MARQYRAVSTSIKAGLADGSVKVFEPGEVVTGLTSEMMRELWDAGVLEQVDVVVPPTPAPASVTEKSAEEKTSADDGSEVPKGGDEANA